MTPRTKEQNEGIREQTKQAIKMAALELFAHNGFHNTKVGQIAKEAGISKGLMYNYFESKEALLKDIVEEASDTGDDMMKHFLESEETPRNKLIMMIEGSFQMVQGNLHYWKLMTSLAFQEDVFKGMEAVMKERKDAVIAVMEQLFKDYGSKDPKKETLLVGAVLDGVFIHYMHVGEEYPIDDMKHYIIEKFL